MAATKRFDLAHNIRQTPVTWLLIAVNVALYLVVSLQGQQFLGAAVNSRILNDSVLLPVGLYFGQGWRIITSGFMHFGLMHIAFNMWALYVLGRDIETAIGSSRFTALYFVSLLAGSASVLWFSPINTATAGASGAIFGLLGAELIVLIRLRMKLNNFIMVIVLNVIIGVSMPSVSIQAHFGGFVAGLLMALAFIYAPRLLMKLQNTQVMDQKAASTVGWAAALVVATAVGVALWYGYEHVIHELTGHMPAV